MDNETETILLVEDEPYLRVSVRRALTGLGYKVLEAATGADAIEIWRQHRNEIRLLFTDIVMPNGMNGWELAEKLAEDEPGLKIIYSSGYSADMIDKEFPLVEGVNFLSKPFETHRLAQTIRLVLDTG